MKFALLITMVSVPWCLVQGVARNLEKFSRSDYEKPLERIHTNELNVKIPMWVALQIDNWLTEKLSNSQLQQIMPALVPGLANIPTDILGFIRSTLGKIMEYTNAKGDLDLSCAFCDSFLTMFVSFIQSGKPLDQLIPKAMFLCRAANTLSQDVCEGFIKGHINVISDVVRYNNKKDNRNAVKKICTALTNHECDKNVPNIGFEWEVELPEVPKPPVEPIVVNQKSKQSKVLHLTDIHLDLRYKEGSLATCSDPACCQAAPTKKEGRLAGRFGDYSFCDVPEILFVEMLKHIKENHKDIDYIYWTGDMPAHDGWRASRREVKESLETTYKLMKEHLPDVPIYSSVGNHDTSPLNCFVPPEMKKPSLSMTWLYETLAHLYGESLDEQAKKTILQGGHYSYLVKPGFRIISINSNYCYSFNWYNHLAIPDPGRQLHWLAQELQKAEEAGEKVHILSHIPTGSNDCMKPWSRQYRRIINRYESTIMAQFAGHTHYDEFQVYYDMKNVTRPTGVMFVSPSVTPYNDVNPGYRIFYIDDSTPSSSHAVSDYETWVTDLEHANKIGHPHFYKLYSARSAYSLDGGTPKDMDNLVRRMISDSTLFDTYFRHWSKNSTSSIMRDCGLSCRIDLLCFTVTHDITDKELCRQIETAIRRKSGFLV